jgi:hypothetical protein
MVGVTSKTLADFVAARSREEGLEQGAAVSPATVNKELHHLRATLKKAHRWGYLSKLPELADCFLREPGKLRSAPP